MNLKCVVRCVGQLLNVTFSFLNARCIPWPGFVLIRVSCRCVIDVVWLGLVCCTRLLPPASTRVRQPELRPQLIHWNLKYHGIERPNLLGLSCLLRFDSRTTFPTLFLTPERWMGSRVHPTVGCFPELYFLEFSVAHVLVGLRKQFINKVIFPTSGKKRYNM